MSHFSSILNLRGGKKLFTEPFSPSLQTQSPLPAQPFPFPSGQSPQHGFSVYFQLLRGGGFPKMSKSLRLPWKSSQLGEEDRFINNYKLWIKSRYKPGAWGLASMTHSGTLEKAGSLWHLSLSSPPHSGKGLLIWVDSGSQAHQQWLREVPRKPLLCG